MKNKHFKRAVGLAAAAAVVYSQATVCFALDTKGITEYNDDDIVRVIVKLKDDPVMTGEKAADMGADFLDTAEAEARQKKLADTQEKAEAQIRELYPDINVGYSYTTLLNGFSCDIPFDLIDDVEDISLVDSVHISRSHKRVEMYSAADTCGVPQFRNETGLTGEGEVVAVIDSEIDITHDMFKPIDDKKVRLKKEDIQKVKDSGAGFNTGFDLDVDKAYVSSKLPYVVCYNDKYDPYSLDDVEQYHGTHVSGIAAGNEITDKGGRTISGIAPDAQIVFMSCKDEDDEMGSYINDEYAVAAIEDAVKLNVTSINLSFGMDSEFEDDLYEDIIGRVEDSGIVLCAAAGNDSSFYNYPENPDVSTLNSPSSIKGAFSVASANNSKQFIGLMTLNETGEEIEYMDGFDVKLADAAGGSSIEYVFCGGGSAEDIDHDKVAGKLILIDSSMGLETFSDIGKRAAETGAVGVIAIDFTDDPIHEIFADGLPFVLVTKEDGQKLLKAEDKTVSISASGKLVDAKQGISSFSSKGVCQDLELKPDITGIGGNVASAGYNNTIVNLSGTSMATPMIAGCSALAGQYVSKNMPQLSGEEKVKFIRNILMNTAKPFTEEGVFVSPRDQGAGLANLSAVENAKVLMIGTDGDAKISLGSGLGDSFTVDVTVKNYSKEDVSFKNASLDLVTDGIRESANGIKFLDSVQKLNASVSGTDDLKTIKAGEEKKVKLTVKLDSTQTADLKKDFTNGFFAEGYISLSGASNSSDISIPVLGFCGDWINVPIFDKTWTQFGNQTGMTYFETNIGVDSFPLDVSFSKLAQLYGKYGLDDGTYDESEEDITSREEFFRYGLSRYFRSAFVNAKDEDLKGIFNDKICISPNGDGWGDDLAYETFTLREAMVSDIEIYNSDGTLELGTVSPELPANPMWSSTSVANNINELSEGEYKAVITGYINSSGAQDNKQKVEQKFEVDTTAPELKDIKIEEKNGRKILSFTASDKNLDGIYVLGKGKGGVYGEYDPSAEKKGYDLRTMSEMMGDFTHYHNHDDEELEMNSTLNTTLFNNFVTAKEPEEIAQNDADFFDIIHCEPNSSGSYGFKYDITDLDEYSVCVLDKAFNMSDYGYDVPYVGNIADIGEVSEGTVLKLKVPDVVCNVPVKKQGWVWSEDGYSWDDLDISKPVTRDLNMTYISYMVDTGTFTTYASPVMIKVKGVEKEGYSLQITDSKGKTENTFVTTNNIDLSYLPEDDYLIIVKKPGYVPRAYHMHIDAKNNHLQCALAKLGDVDVNGSVDIVDAVSVIAQINGVTPLDDYALTVADTDRSGRVDIEDAVLIINQINGVKPIPEYTE